MSTGDMVKLNYSVNIEDFAKAGDISSNTKKVLKKLGIPSDITRRAAIVTYEAEMNIIIHSSGGEIIVNIDTAKIEIIARDYGPGIPDIDRAMQKGYSTASDHVRELGFGAGMGLPNMKRCSDGFLIESQKGKGTTVTSTIHIHN
ncbi:MAG: ATP-binding protein [Bacillota bacterium]|jgi:anti-sigma regulatory factor (Ser/Thr protein kinase)|nr:ATP-binding protein [Bacillota bacterium]MDD3298146.1 ATP-binding protein [Bacillota bacterium]MDD3851851.1 ATP-binding protein [Bacillota bacterium]MDD4708310.1 ATP-binding protein [Bacillota bacterium]